MYRKSGKKFLVSILTVIGVFVLLGATAWAATPLAFTAAAGQPKGNANNGALTIKDASASAASTSYYCLPSAGTGKVVVEVNIGGGSFAAGDVLSTADSSDYWGITSAPIKAEADGTLKDGTTITLTSDSNATVLPVSEDIVITVTDTQKHSETVTLSLNKVFVNLPVAMPDVVLYDGAQYAIDKAVKTTLVSNGKKLGFSGNVKMVKDDGSGWAIDTNTPNREAWNGSNVTAALTKDLAGTAVLGVSFYNDANQTTVLPKNVSMPTAFYFNADQLIVTDDNNAKVAGVSGTDKIGTFKASVSPAILSLDKTVATFEANAPASGSIVATVYGKEIKALKIANVDGTSADVAKTMNSGLHLAASVAATTPPSGKIVFSDTPKSDDKATFKVIAYDDAAATSIIASADLTVTVTKSQPVAGYTMTVENFTTVASKDVGTQAHAIAFKKDGSSVAMPTLDTLTFTQPSDPADPSKVVWNGLTLVADKATGQVTMTGTPLTDGNRNFTLHATAQAGTIADWTFHVTVSKSQPTPSGGSGGGCDAGFGLAGLLALGACAGLFRRGR